MSPSGKAIIIVFTYIVVYFLRYRKLSILIFNIGGENRLSELLVDISKIRPEDLDKEILRTALIAELDAVNIYEQMANLTKNENVRQLLLDVARKEKVHIAMFETVLLQNDKEFLKIYADYSLARAKRHDQKS